jgi:hypothetical protein
MSVDIAILTVFDGSRVQLQFSCMRLTLHMLRAVCSLLHSTSYGSAAMCDVRMWRVWRCSLDTGRLNLETYQLFEAVEKHYNIHIEYTFPDAQETMDLVRAKGMFSFYEDGHQECCRVRKVSPELTRRPSESDYGTEAGYGAPSSGTPRRGLPAALRDGRSVMVTGGLRSCIWKLDGDVACC